MSKAPTEKPASYFNASAAHLLLRLWVSLRLFMAGVDKFRAGNGESTTFSFENYDKKSSAIAKLMSTNSFLPEAMCNIYAHSIGYVLLLVGLWVAFGLLTNLSLIAAGFTILSLGFGLAALPDDTEVVLIGVHILVVAGALLTAQYRAFSLDGIIKGK